MKTVEHVLKMKMTTRALVFLASLEETAKQVMKLPFKRSQFRVKDQRRICRNHIFANIPRLHGHCPTQ